MPLKPVSDPNVLAQLNGEAPDYDYAGARAAGINPAANEHWPDTYKLPNHITFSTDSKYSKPGQEGGTWSQIDGKWHYAPSSFVLSQHSPDELKQYFARAEPDSVLDLPKARNPVTDPNLIAQLNGDASPAEPEKLLGPWSSALVRPLAKGVASLPLLAMDSGVALRNLGGYAMDKIAGRTPENFYELPSASFEKALDSYTTKPQGLINKGAEFVSSALVGSRTPAPQAASQAPSNFVRGDVVRQATLDASQKAGYVVPPSTTNPSATNKILESLGGKIATAQDAAVRNQEVTNTLAKRALGLSEDAPITKEALGALRSEAGNAYQTLRRVGEVALDDAATQSLDEVAARYTGSKLKEALGGGTDVPKIVQAIKDEPLTGDTAVDAIALLRDKAATAYAQGDKATGKAYRTISAAIENLMERNLSGDALKAFKEARQLIAKSYSVESALNSSTGNVVATKLASQLAKDKPLSGDLLTAARFGQAFPKAVRETLDSGSVSHLDSVLASGAAVMQKQPWYLAYPFLRQGVRAGLLSDAGQALATPGAGQVPSGLLMGGVTTEEMARRGLLSQE